MLFTNTTPLSARLSIGRGLPDGLRPGLLLAKATFSFDERGRARLDDQDPLPLLDADTATPLGLLPRDNLPRNDPAFEVFLLGKAHAPFGRPVPHVRVALAVADCRRELDVYGDRFWLGRGADAALSAPAPFLEMPLTYSRAFGGTADIEIDVDSPVEVHYPENPDGVGFDLEPIADGLHRDLNCPAGFPRFTLERGVPNIESADSPLRRWSDNPQPEVWCAVPLSGAIHNRRSYLLDPDGGVNARAKPQIGQFYRAHPGWVLPEAPGKGAPIVLHNLTKNPSLELRFPNLDVYFDYALGPRDGSRALGPRAIILLPEQQKFAVLFALTFVVDPPTGAERSGRLRIKEQL